MTVLYIYLIPLTFTDLRASIRVVPYPTINGDIQMQKRLLSSLLIAAALCCTGSLIGNAQDRSAFVQMEGYAGSVRIIPNAQRKEVTIVLAMNYESSSKTNQIVFHIQEATDSMPHSWSGTARVLVGSGTLAIVSKGLPGGLLFKFPENIRPASLDGSSFDEYPVFGIARFGEKSALTPDQIQQLATTGQIAGTSTAFDPNAIRVTSDDASMGIPRPNDSEPVQCIAGGPGSSSCGASACTVTCGAGYYSCCVGGTCLCQANSK